MMNPKQSEDKVYQQALQEHAIELGINLEEDPEFKWIVEKSLVAPLPEGWVQLKEIEGDYAGSLYYYHEESGQTQWEHPSDQFYRMQYEQQKEAKLSTPQRGSAWDVVSRDSTWEVVPQTTRESINCGECETLNQELTELKKTLKLMTEESFQKEKLNSQLKNECTAVQAKLKLCEDKEVEITELHSKAKKDLEAAKIEFNKKQTPKPSSTPTKETSILIQNLNDQVKKYKDRASLSKVEKKKSDEMMKDMHKELNFALETGETLHRDLSVAQNELEELKITSQAKIKEFKDLAELFEGRLTECLRELKEARKAEANAFQAKKEWKEKYLQERNLRQSLGKKLMELQGNIFVICRVRPLLRDEATSCIEVIDSEQLFVDNVSHNFNAVFGPESTQDEVFAEVQPSALSVLEGYNVCIFAYGQTGSGKTFTMEGTASQRGVNHRAISGLFEYAASSIETNYAFSVSMLEVYNESIRDLLCVPEDSVGLDIRSGSVEGLKEYSVSSMEDVETLICQGFQTRTVGSNNVNEHSSRSHLVLCLKVAATRKGSQVTTYGKLNLVDLAGSERLKNTNAVGVRLKEAQNINKSLSALGDVVGALGKSPRKDAHIPYRNSKLTFLLQDSLSANSRVLMFVNVGPSLSSASESQCSLKFAGRCRAVKLGAAKKTAKA
mmetsp:Transcript_34066/g.40067  ORF Transcript_34066/g.40067 Transcript_34066/m.40067 type:complete len:668 (+) Transcript_34066:232-2235(+)